MKKIIFLSLLTSSILLNASDLEKSGVEVTYKNSHDKEISLVINRDKPKECIGVKFDPEVILGGDVASKSVPEACKRSFVTYFGKISPMKFSENVETVGEVEVLEFINDSKSDKSKLLVDSRTESWFYQSTIPTAVNVPFTYLDKSQYPDEFKESLETFGVKVIDGKYDFSNAKEILLFCNGVWCGQSPIAMKNLMEIGYPESKMKWYRGGIQSWMSLGLTTIKP